jgi:F-type H+-transporting ATPase subunit delta
VFRPNSGLAPVDARGQLAAATDLVSSSPELRIALLSPAVTKPRKEAVIARLADDLGLHRLIKNFLLVLVSHRRISELQHIQKEFELVADEREGWIRAEIMSAKDLSAPQKEEIERALGTRLGKFIRAQYLVDPALIAGIRARVASVEYDASLRGKLESMRQRLVARA